MPEPQLLRIRWNVVPGTRKFLAALRPYALIADAAFSSSDFTRLESLSLEDQRQQLRDLASRGDMVTAVYAARKIHGCGLAQARKIVESLGNS